tara:strand:- start:5249 stop:6313 length:1065 start_codon:yes stop_codon:yes gene_type:complete
MKVLHCVYNLDKFSGAAYQALDLSLWLRKNSKIVCCILNRTEGMLDSPNTDFEGVQVTHSNSSYISHAITCFKSIYNADIIHLHGFNFTALLIAILLRKKVFLKSTLLGVDDFKTLCEKSKLRYINRYLIKNISVNNPLSEVISNINKNYICSSKIKLIPNSVPVGDYTFYDRKKNVFLIVGAITKRKKTYQCIQYFIDNFSDIPDSELYIIGPIDEKIKELNSQYISKCRMLTKAHQHKIFFTGKLSKKNVLEYFAVAKGLIFFSDSEGFGSVVIEAQINNCVPLVTGFGGIEHELISNGYNGFILDNEKQAITIKSIEKLLVSSAMSQGAYDKYKPDNIFSLYEPIYKGMLN